jgi:ketopantoate reductase
MERVCVIGAGAIGSLFAAIVVYFYASALHLLT